MAQWTAFTEPQRRPAGPSPFFVLALVAFMAVGGVWIWRTLNSGGQHSPLTTGYAEPLPVVPRGNLAEDEEATIELFQRNSAAVVHITTARNQRTFMGYHSTQTGSGTGFLWDARGYIVTNFHVVKNNDSFQVTLSDGRTSLDAKLVGQWPFDDVAVLKVDPPAEMRLTTISLGSSHDLMVGQKVFAIGNPFGLDQTLTTGIISGLGRTIQSVAKTTIKDVIQTDAAINPGNSGGPLLDSAGRLIGINTAIYSPSGASAGIGFAVPVDRVNVIVPQLIAKGTVARPDLGLHPFSDSRARRWIRSGAAPNGVIIGEVVEGGPADRAGLRPIFIRGGRYVLQDVILTIDGVSVNSQTSLMSQLLQKEVGQTVVLQVYRAGGRIEEIRVQLYEAQG